ncbi:MAG: M14 family zinc carboxypeptidase [Saprospiraceae bacterium]
MIEFRNIYFLLLLFVFGAPFQKSFSQSEEKTIYQKVRVHLDGKGLRPLAALGVEVEHGFNRAKDEIVNFYSIEEVEQVKAAGFKVDIILPDAIAHYLEESKKVQPVSLEQLETRDQTCYGAVQKYRVPFNFKYGSMGSYLTLQEIMNELDLMKVKYPNLISNRMGVNSFVTKEGNVIQYVKISDYPEDDEHETETKILYTSLHHAREPMSMMQMIYFMWYLLENYERDPEIQYLVNKSEMFFVPCVNPDGYEYNRLQHSDGGGLWRKNRNNIGAVDINRNYSLGWAYDNDGSSPLKSSDTYRGTHSNSEAETKSIYTLTKSNSFQMAVNYHSFANVMIYPWGYLEANTIDSLTYINFAQQLTEHTDFSFGLNNETLGYPINGTADDYMYGEGIYAYTFECGPVELTDTTSFWPLADKILPMCASFLNQNINTLWMLNGGLKVQQVSDKIIPQATGNAQLKITRVGLTNDLVNINIHPISNNVVNFSKDYVVTLNHLESKVIDIPYALKSNPKGEVIFEVNYFYGTYNKRDTITYQLFNYKTRFENHGEDLTAFKKEDFGQNWIIDYDDYYDTFGSYALNTLSTYSKAENKTLETKNPIYIPQTDSLAFLSFYAKWYIEKNVDYLKVYASKDGVFFAPLCGSFSQLGSIDQGEEEPVLDGFQPDWVNIVMDLSNYTGEYVYLKFIFRSDAKVNKDGVNIDNIKVIGVPRTNLADDEVESKSAKAEISPNPADDFIYVYRDIAQDAIISLYDATGKLQVRKNILNKVEGIDVHNLPSGMYLYVINEGFKNQIITGKLIIAKN